MKVEAWTPMVRTRDMAYPVYLRDFKLDFTNVSIGSFVYEENLVEFGYFPVLDSEIPDADVVVEVVPTQSEDGKWYKTYTSRSFTTEEVAQNLIQQKSEYSQYAYDVYNQDLLNGISFDGDLFIVDAQEVVNLMGTLSLSEESLGQDKSILVRKQDSGILVLTPEQAVTKIKAILSVRENIHQNLLVYLQQVMGSPDRDSVPSVPETFKG